MVEFAREVRVAEEALEATDGDRLALLGQYARGLALLLLRAHATADSRQSVALFEHRDAAGQVAFDDGADELADVDVDRAALLARRVGTLQAAVGLGECLVGRVAERDLVEARAALLRAALGHWRARSARGAMAGFVGACAVSVAVALPVAVATRVGERCRVVYR